LTPEIKAIGIDGGDDGEKTLKTVRTYMNFSSEIDPAKILTMADLELSIALATPLVTFNQEREVVSALAEKWTPNPPNKMVFTLRPNLHWSDGSPITAKHFKNCLERANKTYPDDLKALFDSIEKIEATDDHTITFITKADVFKSGILLKLTEPMYGLVALIDGALDLKKSAGPFQLKRFSKDEISLDVNKNWYQYKSEMPTTIEIKRTPKGRDLIESFANDEWANLVSGSSLMKSTTSELLKHQGFKTWNRTLDRVFNLFPSKRLLDAGGSELLKMLSLKLDRKKLLSGYSGFASADQFFPRGYELWSQFQPSIAMPIATPVIKNLTVIIPDSPVGQAIKPELINLINTITGINTHCETVPLNQINERMKLGDYDLLATGIAVADPNFEGAMSFFIEKTPAFIPSGLKPFDFAQQLKDARGLPTSKDRARKMRELILKIQESGYVLPLIHFSSVAVAKSGVDISGIPNSDETVLFSKVRMK
jgi:MarR-like DNA-binding transcriptional regulator SgrR of sgrS sRNA